VRWRSLLELPLHAALGGVLIECVGGTCPLTPLENPLRTLSGETNSTRDFIAPSLLAVLYPEGLTRSRQVTLGLVSLLHNVMVYSRV
jgi:hypothetical protein